MEDLLNVDRKGALGVSRKAEEFEKPSATFSGRIPLEVKDNGISPLKKQPSRIGIPSHISTIEEGPSSRKYQCDICSRRFKAKRNIGYHYQCASDESKKRFLCDICGNGFMTKGHLDYHLKKHEGSKPFVCFECREGFDQKADLIQHLQIHPTKRPLPYACHLCWRQFSRKQNLEVHLRCHSNEQPFQCDRCGKRYYGLSNLKRHITLQHPHKEDLNLKHQCLQCGKGFAMQTALFEHIRDRHKQRPFPCEHCDATFHEFNELCRHVVNHTGIHPFKCPMCEETFLRTDNMTRHIQNIHGERSREVAKQLSAKSILQFLKDEGIIQVGADVPGAKAWAIATDHILTKTRLMPSPIPKSFEERRSFKSNTTQSNQNLCESSLKEVHIHDMEISTIPLMTQVKDEAVDNQILVNKYAGTLQELSMTLSADYTNTPHAHAFGEMVKEEFSNSNWGESPNELQNVIEVPYQHMWDDPFPRFYNPAEIGADWSRGWSWNRTENSLDLGAPPALFPDITHDDTAFTMNGNIYPQVNSESDKRSGAETGNDFSNVILQL